MEVEHKKSGHHIGRPTVDIPPRKLLSSAKSPSSASSPRRDNNKDEKDYSYDSDSDDPYAGDHFRMYEFKIRRCTRSRGHDWTDCPFSHPGEKARRRDPRRYHYTGEVCPEFQHGGDCSRGDKCSFSHGVFECWLHPNRYRTEACKDGKHCKRKVCFFAHSPRQLRVLPPPPPEDFISGGGGSPLSVLSNKNNRCCLFCSHSSTSTLLGLSRSPSLSPPLSPAVKAAALSRLSRRSSASNGYKEVLNDLISSLDSFSLTEALTASSSCPVNMPVSTAAMIASSNLSNHHYRLPPWLDVGERDLQLQHSSLQFAISTSSTPSYLHGQIQPPQPSFFSDEFTPRGGRLSDFTAAVTAAAEAWDKNSFEVGSSGDLDLGWVNDLLT